MLQRFKHWFHHSKAASKEMHNQQELDVTLGQVKIAILQWEKDMDDKISRTGLLNEDRLIDLTRLRRYLGGVSNQKFYMSRITFEVFEEKDMAIARYLDIVQAAVDDYMDEHANLPIISGSHNRQVHYDRLLQGHYLKERPDIPLFLTTEEFMLTHEPNWYKQHD